MTDQKVDVPPAADTKPVDTEKSMADFFQNEVLSDMTLMNPSSKQTSR